MYLVHHERVGITEWEQRHCLVMPYSHSSIDQPINFADFIDNIGMEQIRIARLRLKVLAKHNHIPLVFQA